MKKTATHNMKAVIWGLTFKDITAVWSSISFNRF